MTKVLYCSQSNLLAVHTNSLEDSLNPVVVISTLLRTSHHNCNLSRSLVVHCKTFLWCFRSSWSSVQPHWSLCNSFAVLLNTIAVCFNVNLLHHCHFPAYHCNPVAVCATLQPTIKNSCSRFDSHAIFATLPAVSCTLLQSNLLWQSIITLSQCTLSLLQSLQPSCNPSTH